MAPALGGILGASSLVTASALIVWHIDTSVAPGPAGEALEIAILASFVAIVSLVGLIKGRR